MPSTRNSLQRSGRGSDTRTHARTHAHTHTHTHFVVIPFAIVRFNLRHSFDIHVCSCFKRAEPVAKAGPAKSSDWLSEVKVKEDEPIKISDEVKYKRATILKGEPRLRF